jgi:ketosteroid isomerase-like protein
MEMSDRVRNLVGSYAEAVLRNDPALFADTWAADAVWSTPGAPAIAGRDDIARSFRDRRGTFRLCVQEILNGRITTAEADRATATWQVRELQWRADGTGSELLGVYDDVMVVGADGELRFARRDFELLYRGPVDLRGNLRLPDAEPSGGQPVGDSRGTSYRSM